MSGPIENDGLDKCSRSGCGCRRTADARLIAAAPELLEEARKSLRKVTS